MRRAAAVVLVGLLPWAAPPDAGLEAQGTGDTWLRVTPALLGSARNATPGLRLQVDLQRRLITTAGTPRRVVAGIHADLPFAWHADRNPQTLQLHGGAGILVAGLRRPTPVPGQPPPLTAPRRWGFFEAQVQVRAEAAQRVDDADVAVVASIAYEHDQDRLWFVPHVELALGLVECVGCDLPDDDSSSRRLDLLAGWSIPLAAVMPSPLAPLRIRPSGRYFRAWGVGESLAELRAEEGAWADIELAYAVDGVAWLHEVHAGWRGGRLPVRLAERTAWSFGFTLVP